MGGSTSKGSPKHLSRNNSDSGSTIGVGINMARVGGAPEFQCPDMLSQALHAHHGDRIEEDVLWRQPLSSLPFQRYRHVVMISGSFMGPCLDHVNLVQMANEKMASMGLTDVMFVVFPCGSLIAETAVRRDGPILGLRHQLVIKWLIENRLLMTGIAFHIPRVTPHVFVCADDYDAMGSWERVYLSLVDAIDRSGVATKPRVYYMFGESCIESVTEVLERQRSGYQKATTRTDFKSSYPLILCTKPTVEAPLRSDDDSLTKASSAVEPTSSMMLSESQVANVLKLNELASLVTVYKFPRLAGHSGSRFRRAVINSDESSEWETMMPESLVPAMKEVLAERTPSPATPASDGRTSARGIGAVLGSRSRSPARLGANKEDLINA